MAKLCFEVSRWRGVLHVGSFVVSAALLPFDIYTLVKNAMEIDACKKGNKDEEPEVVKMMRKLADELEGDCLTMTI